MWKLAVVILAGATAFAVHPTHSNESQVPPPTLKVSVFPYAGVIPAGFANGLPVYMFQASLERRSRDGEVTLVLHDQELLQKGMSKQLHEYRDQLELRGAIAIDATGSARYSASVSDSGEILVASAAHLALSGDARPRRER